MLFRICLTFLQDYKTFKGTDLIWFIFLAFKKCEEILAFHFSLPTNQVFLHRAVGGIISLGPIPGRRRQSLSNGT